MAKPSNTVDRMRSCLICTGSLCPKPPAAVRGSGQAQLLGHDVGRRPHRAQGATASSGLAPASPQAGVSSSWPLRVGSTPRSREGVHHPPGDLVGRCIDRAVGRQGAQTDLEPGVQGDCRRRPRPTGPVGRCRPGRPARRRSAAGRPAGRRRSSAPGRGPPQPLDQVARGRCSPRPLDGPVPGEAAGGGHSAGEHGRQQRLVELDHRLVPRAAGAASRRPARRSPRPATARARAGHRGRPAPGRRAGAPAVAASVHGPATAYLDRARVALGAAPPAGPGRTAAC